MQEKQEEIKTDEVKKEEKAAVKEDVGVLDTPIGNIETDSLEAKPVTIKEIRIKEVNYVTNKTNKTSQKVMFKVEHPDKTEELIEISSVRFLKQDKIVTQSGTWLNLDKEDNIQKGSALTMLMTQLQAKTLEECKDKVIETILDNNGYLCFKAY